MSDIQEMNGFFPIIFVGFRCFAVFSTFNLFVGVLTSLGRSLQIGRTWNIIFKFEMLLNILIRSQVNVFTLFPLRVKRHSWNGLGLLTDYF